MWMRHWLGSLLLLLITPVAWGASVDVIVNPDQAQVTLTPELLRAIFSMRLRDWPSGEPIHVFVLPDSAEASNQFCRDRLGTYPYVMRTVWDRMVFTGTGLAPIVVRSEEEMRARVRATPGAIGYVTHQGDHV